MAVIACAVLAIVFSAFTFMQTSSIKGTVAPADKAVNAVAISSTNPSDSASAPVTNGSFEIQNVKPGEYLVTIHAMTPYGNATKTGVMVESGKTTDVGEIQLVQK